MAIAPNTTFVAGNILTAVQQNAFPFGILGKTNAVPYATTTANYETFITTTATVLANRSIKVSVQLQPYGYVGGFNIQILEGINQIFASFSLVSSATDAIPNNYVFVYTPSSAGAKTYYVQLQRVGGVNLSQYTDPTKLAQIIIEDVGTA